MSDGLSDSRVRELAVWLRDAADLVDLSATELAAAREATAEKDREIERLRERAERAMDGWRREGKLACDNLARAEQAERDLAKLREENERLRKRVAFVGASSCTECGGFGGDCDAADDGSTVSWLCQGCGGTGIAEFAYTDLRTSAEQAERHRNEWQIEAFKEKQRRREAERELSKAREKIKELNRRYQRAEAGVRDSLEKAERSGGSIGRALSRAGYELMKRERDAAREALERAIDALNSLPVDALGIGGDPRTTAWSIRDELVANLRRAREGEDSP